MILKDSKIYPNHWDNQRNTRRFKKWIGESALSVYKIRNHPNSAPPMTVLFNLGSVLWSIIGSQRIKV